jgi:hypothetical protein
MGFGDRLEGEKLEAAWDKIVGTAAPDPARVAPTNPYDARIEQSEEPIASDDANLLTAFTLLASHGLESAIGQMMAHYAEATLPQTLTQLFQAYERTAGVGNREVQALRQNLRGMIIFLYAWSYCMARTKQLSVRDQHIHTELLILSETQPDTEERSRLTKTAEQKLETTLGLLLHARDDAKKQHGTERVLFFEGALMILYALANTHFGKAVMCP